MWGVAPDWGNGGALDAVSGHLPFLRLSRLPRSSSAVQVQSAGRRGTWQEGKRSIHLRTPTQRNFSTGRLSNTLGAADETSCSKINHEFFIMIWPLARGDPGHRAGGVGPRGVVTLSGGRARSRPARLEGGPGRRHLCFCPQRGHFTQVGQRLVQKPGDMHLGDAQLLGDLPLVLAYVKAKVDERPLSRRKRSRFRRTGSSSARVAPIRSPPRPRGRSGCAGWSRRPPSWRWRRCGGRRTTGALTSSSARATPAPRTLAS